jgi:uncharacterized protein (DUF488 family)
MHPVATIGYERAPQSRVIEALRAAGVELLIDVRAVAASRRAGFSKTLLGGSLEAAGIGYLHLRDLGTPKDGRIAARAGRISEMRAIFDDHMTTAGALAALDQAVQTAGLRRVCLLCHENDPACCHRTAVAERITARTGQPILHLYPDLI